MISPLVSGDGGRLEEGLDVLIGGLTILTDELEKLEEGLGVLIGALKTDELESEVATVFATDIDSEVLVAQGGGV